MTERTLAIRISRKRKRVASLVAIAVFMLATSMSVAEDANQPYLPSFAQATALSLSSMQQDWICLSPAEPVKDWSKTEVKRLMNLFSWRNFISSNWPVFYTDGSENGLDKEPGWEARRTASLADVISEQNLPRWMTWKKSAQILGGQATVATTPDTLPLVSRLDRVRLAKGEGTGFKGPMMLYDQNGQKVYYEIRMNDSGADYVQKNTLYTLEGQEQFAKKRGDVFFQSGQCKPYGFFDIEGIIETKLAWKIIGQGDIPERFLRRTVQIKNEQTGTWEEVEVGLVGMHLSHKTRDYMKWVWSTFEQVDNVQSNPLPDGSASTPSFYNPDCSQEDCPINCPPEDMWLANNGKIDASTQRDLETQVLVAHLPFVFRPRAEQVLVIGLASGISAGSVTLHQAPQHIDIVELEPAVVAASHMFDAHNHRPLDDTRVQLSLNDARNHLLLTQDGTYDVVSSEPSNPWLSGVSNLFTQEFFTLGKQKLQPGGVWVQWVQTYGMAPVDVRSLLATFADVYAQVRLFRINNADLVLVGSDAPLPFQAAAVQKIFTSNQAVAQDLAGIGFRRAEDVLSLYQFGRETLLTLVSGVEHNTDDNMRIEYSAPLHLHEDTAEANAQMLQQVAEIPLGAVQEGGSLIALARAYAVHDWSWRRALETIEQALILNPADAKAATLQRLYQKRARRIAHHSP